MPEVNQSNARSAIDDQSYAGLKARALRDGVLYEDHSFPASPSSIGDMTTRSLNAADIVWKRPSNIIAEAEFLVGNATRFDVVQGDSLANCWFVSATACLAATNPNLLKRCVPFDQSLTKDYTGIFRFNFWNFDNWVEIVVDDRLPTINGKLIFAHNSDEPNEFWVPLFEKAYAKLKGSYANLDGGQTTYALVDFTGGISERITLAEKRFKPGNLFDVMYAVLKRSSMMGCEINSRAGFTSEVQLSNGLFRDHAYAITNLIKLTTKTQKAIKLVRIKNPWGEGEWKGAWSDNSREWDAIPDNVKNQIEFMKKDEGEFWMSFENFVDNFDALTMCHLQPEEFSAEVSSNEHHSEWEVQRHHDQWIRGFNAGGSSRFSSQRFWTNPQFGITTPPVAGTVAGTAAGEPCHVIVSLMQKSNSWDAQNIVSFSIYQVKSGLPVLLTGANYDKTALLLAESGPSPAKLREVTAHFDLPAGNNFVIIPFTLEAGQEAEFLLRIYSETKVTSQLLDVPTRLGAVPEKSQTDRVVDTFKKSTNGEQYMEASELTDALNKLIIEESANPNGFPTEGYVTLDVSRSLVALYSKEKGGLLTLEEFVRLLKDLIFWTNKFNSFDGDRSGNIDTYELKAVFDSVGISLSRKVLASIVHRYGGKDCRLSRHDFIHSCCKLLGLNECYAQMQKKDPTGNVELGIENWLAATLFY